MVNGFETELDIIRRDRYSSPMRRLIILAVLFSALGATALSVVAMERFPVGVRIALPATPTMRFEIEASGPAVLSVTAESRDLRRLTIATGEALVEATAVDGRASCFIPVYSSGTVEVRIETSGGATPVLVTTSYGLGEVVRTAIQAPQPSAPTSVATSVAVPTPPIPPPTAVAASPVVVPVAIAPPVPSVEPRAPQTPPAPSSAAIAFPSALKMIFAGEEVRGQLTDGMTEGFRFYIPNRLGFTVTIEGTLEARLAAEHGALNISDLSSTTPKRLVVAAPNEGHYRLAVRGKGTYRILVEALR
jgi:hypothetical protein